MSDAPIVWITGLPASGKTTLAAALVAALRADGSPALWLDGDDLRPHLAGAGYDAADRERFYAALAHIALLGARGGTTVIISATAQRRAWRDGLRALAGRFIEVYVDADVATCAARDPKGLYRAAAAGVVVGLPGVGAPYEPPFTPEVVVAADLPTATAVATVRAALALSKEIGPGQ